MKAATQSRRKGDRSGGISIHAAREGGDGIYGRICGFALISIHAAREGGDGSVSQKPWVSAAFQSTPPVKAATRNNADDEASSYISIHAAREGGDNTMQAATGSIAQFQSTPPVKAATKTYMGYSFLCWISIHAAREGGDYMARPFLIESNRISIHAAREGGNNKEKRKNCCL